MEFEDWNLELNLSMSYSSLRVETQVLILCLFSCFVNVVLNNNQFFIRLSYFYILFLGWVKLNLFNHFICSCVVVDCQ